MEVIWNMFNTLLSPLTNSSSKESTFQDLLNQSYPFLNYCFTHEEPFSQETLDAHLKQFCESWKTLEWTFHPTFREVIAYYSDYAHIQTVPEDIRFRSSELYNFIRLFICLCALDSYGQCYTEEQMEANFERGRLFLQGGILKVLKSLPPWTTYKDNYNNWTDMLEYILKQTHATWFTKLTDIQDPDANKRIKERWNVLLKEAFDNLKDE